MILIFIQILQISGDCQTINTYGICTEGNKETHIIYDQNQFGHAYGLWSKFLSMSSWFDDNEYLFPNNNGYTILVEKDLINDEIKFLYCQQQHVKESETTRLSLYMGQERDMKVIGEIILENSQYEGVWILHYFAFSSKMVQIIISNTENQLFFWMFQVNVNFPQLSGLQIGPPVQFQFGYQTLQYGYFMGMLSQPNIFQSPIFFPQASDFYSLIQIFPQPSSTCDLQVHETSHMRNYNYSKGLIMLESWVQLQYQSVLNVTASLFGIEFKLYYQHKTQYQKICDLQYYVNQGFNESVNGILFQYLIKDVRWNYQPAIKQFYYTENDDRRIIISQNLREWHFVKIQFGFLNDKPTQIIKIWLTDGTQVYQYNDPIFRFDDLQLQIRAGSFFEISQDGVSINAQLTRITTCINLHQELIKCINFCIQECYHSCLDCDGPTLKHCLSCQTNRYLEDRQCKCLLGYVENNDGICIEFINLYPNAQFSFIQTQNQFYKFGMFPLTFEDQIYYIQCPNYKEYKNENDRQILYCLECLNNPDQFAIDLICQSDYIINNYGQYEIQQRDNKDIELYILNIEQQYITLCNGCLSLCNTNIDQNCYLVNQFNKYFKCQKGYYYNQGQCILCNQNCKQCIDSQICTECYGLQILNPQTSICTICPNNCQQCDFDQSLNVYCKVCNEQYSLFQGQCYACGQYCLICIYTYDQIKKEYYNRCIKCLDDSMYYLTIDAVNCAQNTIKDCIYVVQFHKELYLRQEFNTMLFNFKRHENDPNLIYTYCALCKFYTQSRFYGKCEQYESRDSCILAYEYENWQESQVETVKPQCGLYMVNNYYDYETITRYINNKIYSTCQNFIQYCYGCIYDYCFRCFPGYYTQLTDGSCISCPQELKCAYCQQQSKKYKNAYKLQYKIIHQMMNYQSFYTDVFGNEDEFEIFCTKCNPGYELYDGKCIETCPANCDTCIKVEGKNKCVKCKTYTNKALTLNNGECIECPRYCQLCYPKTIEQLQSTNPQFNNSNLIQTTHTCLMLDQQLNKIEYTYNSDYKQYFKSNQQEIDSNQIKLKFNLYCDLEQFMVDKDSYQDKDLFLQQNIRIDEILSILQNQSNFNRIENDYLFTYFGTQQIQYYELELLFLQNCTIQSHSFLMTNLPQMVYFINQATITLNGNFNYLILDESLEILNFNKIIMENINIQISGKQQFLHFFSKSKSQVILNNIQITTVLDSAFNFKLTNLQSLNIQQFQLKNSNQSQVESLFQLEDVNGLINVAIQDFIIQDSKIFNSNLFYLNNENAIVNISLNNFRILASELFNSSILALQQEYYLIFQNLQIDQSNIVNSQPLFKTNLLQNFKMNHVLIKDTSLFNTLVFLISRTIQLENINIRDSQFFNSSLLKSDNLAYNNMNVNLNNFEITNFTYDTQYSILYASSDYLMSNVKLNNWRLQDLKLSNEIIISTYSIKPLLYLSANSIFLIDISIIRKSGISEFYLANAKQLSVQNMNIDNGENQKGIIANIKCEIGFSFYRYMTVLYIEKIQDILIQNMTISNLTIFDVPLIYISSIETQLIKRQDYIQVNNLVVNGCIIQKTKTSNQISIIYVTSQQVIKINFLNCIFFNNFYHTYNTESESNSALIFQFITEKGDVSMDSCSFENNYISQSQNSLISITSVKVAISNSKFLNNNHFTEYFIQNIDWGYQENQLTINFLTNFFPVKALSGNGRFKLNNLSLSNITIIGGIAQQAGCFFLTLKNEGIFTVKDSYFIDTSSSTKGGCFYIEDQAISVNLSIYNTNFNSLYSVQEGGTIYCEPKSDVFYFYLWNVTIRNSFSLFGAFVNLQFSNYLTQIIYIQDCNILYTLEGLSNFIHRLGTIDIAQQGQLIASTAIMSVKYGQIVFKNIVVQLYIIALLESTYSTKVHLTSLVVQNSHYSSKPAIIISCSQDICMVNLDELKILQFSFYNQKSYKILSIAQQQISLSSSCGNTLVLKQQQMETINIDISQFGEDNIPQLILITQIKSSDQISFKNSYLSQNICQGCQNGLVQLNFKEQIQESSNFQLNNVQISQNNCGINGCLTFLYQQSSSFRILTQNEFQIIINKLICSGNQAQNGGCIYSNGIGFQISNSIINDNIAIQYGGGIYYNGDVMNLLLQNNLITNNQAIEGSALFIDENSSPELNKTNNYLESNQQILSTNPTSLTVTLNNYKNLFYNFYTTIDQGFISLSQYSNNSVILTLPSGQEISQYKYFNITNQEYLPFNLTFRIVPLNDYKERLINLTNTECKIQSGYQQNDTIFLTNNYTNYNFKQYNESTQDYNFDDLIIYYGANNILGDLILLFYCNSIKIPIYQQEYPYQITNYISNYSLQVTIQTYKCQLGEYQDTNDDSCHLCDVTKKQYSVQYGATGCQFMDEESTSQITPAQLKLKNGFWRPFINNEIVEKCKNKMENCLGGWKQGDETCENGQLGARCEACDSYNLRGQGYFSQKSLYTCAECQDMSKQVLYIIATSIWMLISLNLTTKGVENMIMEIQKNKVGKIQLIINNNKQTGPYIKMFTNYLQNIAIILNFNVALPNALKSYFTIFGNPSQQLLISTDCFMAQQFTENIMYVKIIQCLINPIFYGLIYLFIYFLLVTFKQVQYNKIVISTLILYLLCLFSPQAIQLAISTLSYQTISGIEWIQANLAYRYNTHEHITWIPYLIVLILLLGLLIPGFLLYLLFGHKKELYINQLRRNWGFMILEYQPKAFYWEFMRILTRELIIIAITFYQDYIIIKCALVFSIMLFYQQGTSFVQPFKTLTLNHLDMKSSLSCLVSIVMIFTLTQSTNLYMILLVIIVLPIGYVFITFLTSLFVSYLQAYEEILDKVKEKIKNKFPNHIERSTFLQKSLISKSERRKIIKARFQKIKTLLHKQWLFKASQGGINIYNLASKLKIQQKYKFVLPNSTLFTNSSDIRIAKSIFLQKN